MKFIFLERVALTGARVRAVLFQTQKQTRADERISDVTMVLRVRRFDAVDFGIFDRVVLKAQILRVPKPAAVIIFDERVVVNVIALTERRLDAVRDAVRNIVAKNFEIVAREIGFVALINSVAVIVQLVPRDLIAVLLFGQYDAGGTTSRVHAPFGATAIVVLNRVRINLARGCAVQINAPAAIAARRVALNANFLRVEKIGRAHV